MAKQDANPPPWDDSMSDGCTGVPDWLPRVGSMVDCCTAHDKAFHWGGDEEDFVRANQEFEDCIRRPWCLFCRMVAWWRRRGVKYFGRSAFNWKGPGPNPDNKKPILEAP